MNFLFKVILAAGIFLLLSYMLGGVEIYNYLTVLVIAFIIGFINLAIQPLLETVKLPVAIYTEGVLMIAVNFLIIYGISSFKSGFVIDSIWWGLGLSVIFSLINYYIVMFESSKKKFRTPL